MFCTNCGKVLPNDSKFCPACGTSVDESSEKEECNAKAADSNILTEIPPEQGSNAPAANAENNIEKVIGKNSEYYLSEFQKIDTGEKAKFNWAAFFLSAYFCLYRKCGELFKKYFLVPLIIILVSCVLSGIGAIKFSLSIIAIAGIASAVGSIWMFVNSIRLGKSFNAAYYRHCKEILAKGDPKKYGTSIGTGILLAVILAVITIAVSSLSTLGILSPGTSENDYDESLLDGEYGVVADADLEEGYLYLNFNWNGPDTLKLYFSDDPTDVIETSYEIIPMDTEGMHSLRVFYDSQSEAIEFFQFYQLDENTYSVYFSDFFTDGAEASGVMVPFTEEYGFTSTSTATTNEGIDNIINTVPSWCTGTYYGDDIYSTVIFGNTAASPFDIHIYRLVDIQNCVITSQDDYIIEFTGDFDINVGSVSGTLESYSDGEDMTLTITASDWNMLPAGTTMEFYCDYRDPNYVESGSSNDICGIYVLPEIPANRLLVWECDDTIFLSMMNRKEILATASLASWELDHVNDCIAFTTYTIGSEEEISGYYAPSTATIEFWGSSDDSLLFACSFEGIFLKQSEG